MTVDNQRLIQIASTQFHIQDNHNQYIQLLQIPQFFGEGKNSFLIGIKQQSFKKQTLLNVFFLDNNNQAIPVTVTQFRQRFHIRCYIQISKDDAIGNGKLIILGVLADNIVSPEYINKVNIKHQRTVYVNPNYKTPSVLRFRNNPTVQYSINKKELQRYESLTKQQQLPISDIVLQKTHPGYFCLNIDKDNMDVSSSVYYEKFLQKQFITTSLQQAKAQNKLFSGSFTNSQVILDGDYSGVLQTNDILKLSNGNITVKNAIFDIGGNYSQSGVQTINASNVQQIIIDYNNIGRLEAKTQTQYQLYLKSINTGSIIDSNSIQFDNEQRTSGSAQSLRLLSYDIYIQQAKKFTGKTKYFSGSLLNSSGVGALNTYVYSQNLKINNTQSTVTGYYKDLLLDKKPQSIQLNPNQQYNSYQFIGQCNFTSTGNTILSNVNISNAYFNLDLKSQLVEFDQFTGSIYSKRLVTQKLSDVISDSYITGSLCGKGSLIPIVNDVPAKQKILQKGDTFSGKAINVDVQLQYFSGSIKKASLHNMKDSRIGKVISNLKLRQAILYGGIYTTGSLFNLQYIQFKDKGSINLPHTFSVKASQSTVQFKNNIQFTKISNSTPIEIDGNFTYITDSTNKTITSFDGIYSPSTLDTLKLYELQTINLIGNSQKLFNTNEIHVFDGDYNKLYIPTALGVNKGVDLKKLYNRLNDGKLLTEYSYLNTLQKVQIINNPNTIPLKVQISNIDIYSGFLKQAQLYYNTNNKSKTYTLLSTFEINTLTNHTQMNIQIDKQLFVQQSTQFLLKYKDTKNRYSPQQNFDIKNNVIIDLQQVFADVVARDYQDIPGQGTVTDFIFNNNNDNGITGTVDNSTTTPTLSLDIGDLKANTFESTVETGSAPFKVSSSTMVKNLNVEYLDGISLDGIIELIPNPDDFDNFSDHVSSSTSNRVVRWDDGKLAASTTLFDDGSTVSCSVGFSASSGIYIGSNGLESIGDISGSGKLNIDGSSSFNNDMTVNGSSSFNNYMSVNASSSFNNDMSVNGDITIEQGHGLYQFSDLNLKQNIYKISNSLDLITNINGVGFDWKQSKIKDYGMIAQEVQNYIPQMVYQKSNYKQINYIKLIPFLLQAIKQLNNNNKILQQRLNEFIKEK